MLGPFLTGTEAMHVDYQPDLYLASNSPRRRELLDQIGVRYAWISAEFDESRRTGEAPEVYVLRLALGKARAGLRRVLDEERALLPVMGADTIVVCKAQVLGKPQNYAQGMEMLSMLSGRTHWVLTAVALVDDEHVATRLSVSRVRFREIAPHEREAYWESGEPLDKAGAYAIQGRGAVFVEHIDGSYSGVMGLPLFETASLLKEFRIDYQRSW